MQELPIPSPAVSKIYAIYLAENGREQNDVIRQHIQSIVEIDPESLKVLLSAFDAFTTLATDQIWRSILGNPPQISRLDAKTLVRRSMFFLDDPTFESFFRWAEYCVAKG